MFRPSSLSVFIRQLSKQINQISEFMLAKVITQYNIHNAYNNVQLSMWSGDISQINDKNKNTIIPSAFSYVVAVDVETILNTMEQRTTAIYWTKLRSVTWFDTPWSIWVRLTFEFVQDLQDDITSSVILVLSFDQQLTNSSYSSMFLTLVWFLDLSHMQYWQIILHCQ